MRRETNPCAREAFHDQAKLPRISAHTLETHSRRRAKPPCRRSAGAGSGRLRELLPARAKWKFVLSHLQPVLGERQPVIFFTLGGAVPSLLNTGISAGAEFFSFGSRRGIWDRHSYFAPFNFQSSKIPIVPSGGGCCTVSAFPTINRLALPGHAAFC